MSFKIAHWCEANLRSGMGHTAKHICEAERKLGLTSVLVDCNNEADWINGEDADVHVCHLFMPLKFLYTKTPKVWVAHGTPDLMFEAGYLEHSKGLYGASDGWMLAQWWLQHADATVTFWPRHEAIWKSLSDKNTRIEGVPLGVDLDFWKPVKSDGKFAGAPSIFTAENCYSLKWPWDLFIALPWVVRDGLPEVKLHAVYIPLDQARFWYPLVNRNGSSFHSYISNRVFDHEELRHAFSSTDFYCGLVRYGDHNYISLQANACGVKTISYRGNPYSSYHVDFGDQRILAQQLAAILKGEVEERQDKSPVVSIMRTAERMKEIYESLAPGKPTGLAVKKPKKQRAMTAGASLATLTVQ